MTGEFSIYGKDLVEYCAKLRALRLPVLPIPDFLNTFSEIVEAASTNPEYHVDESGLDGFLNDVSGEIKDVITNKLRNMSSSGGGTSFESLCERLLQINGYTIERRHQYDGQGGDIDLRCKRSRSDSFIFEGGEVTLLVQVKKHWGVTDKRAVEQVLQMLEAEPNADGCVMSMADGFDGEAIDLAEKKEIVLLNRDEICRLLLSHLSQRDIIPND